MSTYSPLPDHLLNSFADIAVNLTDDMFQGKYRGKQLHSPDFEAVLERSKARGVESMIITGTSHAESRDALAMAERYGTSSSDSGAW